MDINPCTYLASFPGFIVFRQNKLLYHVQAKQTALSYSGRMNCFITFRQDKLSLLCLNTIKPGNKGSFVPRLYTILALLVCESLGTRLALTHIARSTFLLASTGRVRVQYLVIHKESCCPQT